MSDEEREYRDQMQDDYDEMNRSFGIAAFMKASYRGPIQIEENPRSGRSGTQTYSTTLGGMSARSPKKLRRYVDKKYGPILNIIGKTSPQNSDGRPTHANKVVKAAYTPVRYALSASSPRRPGQPRDQVHAQLVNGGTAKVYDAPGEPTMGGKARMFGPKLAAAANKPSLKMVNQKSLFGWAKFEKGQVVAGKRPFAARALPKEDVKAVRAKAPRYGVMKGAGARVDSDMVKVPVPADAKKFKLKVKIKKGAGGYCDDCGKAPSQTDMGLCKGCASRAAGMTHKSLPSTGLYVAIRKSHDPEAAKNIAETWPTCPGCGKKTDVLGMMDRDNPVCMGCVRARHRAVMNGGRCSCGNRANPGQRITTSSGRQWIPCNRCLGTAQQLNDVCSKCGSPSHDYSGHQYGQDRCKLPNCGHPRGRHIPTDAGYPGCLDCNDQRPRRNVRHDFRD